MNGNKENLLALFSSGYYFYFVRLEKILQISRAGVHERGDDGL